MLSHDAPKNAAGEAPDQPAAPSGRLAGAKSATYLRAVNEPESRASRFTAPYMLASDIAYVLSAAELGCTPPEAAKHLLSALIELHDKVDTLDTTVPPADVVAQREAWVTEKVGRADAAWLHLGRNRGESLRCYLPRLYFRQVLYEERRAIVEMIRNLLKRAGPMLEAVAPNYHHLQHSGFTTLGEYLLSWVAVFEPHLERLEQIDRRLSRGPSVFGSREIVKTLYDRVSWRLGFTRRAQARRDGIWVHDQFTEPLSALALIAVDLARLAQDLRIWMTPEFGLFELADEHAGGSSALPHAKVPFGLQAVIGGAAMAATRLAGELTAAINPSEGSEPIYHSASLYGTAADIVASTLYMADVIDKGEFNLDEMQRKSTFDYAGSSEAHDRLVYDFGVPFRTGHRVLGALVRSHHLGEPPPDLAALLRAETGRDIPVDQQEILDIVLGRKIMPSTFDFEGLRELWMSSAKHVDAAATAVTGPSPVERAIDTLIEEAKAWLAGPGLQSAPAGPAALPAPSETATQAGDDNAPTKVE
jgi:argininosuccinate lyase